MKEVQEALKQLQDALERHTCEEGSDEAVFKHNLHHVVVEAQREIIVRGYASSPEREGHRG